MARVPYRHPSRSGPVDLLALRGIVNARRYGLGMDRLAHQMHANGSMQVDYLHTSRCGEVNVQVHELQRREERNHLLTSNDHLSPGQANAR